MLGKAQFRGFSCSILGFGGFPLGREGALECCPAGLTPGFPTTATQHYGLTLQTSGWASQCKIPQLFPFLCLSLQHSHSSSSAEAVSRALGKVSTIQPWRDPAIKTPPYLWHRAIFWDKGMAEAFSWNSKLEKREFLYQRTFPRGYI